MASGITGLVTGALGVLLVIAFVFVSVRVVGPLLAYLPLGVRVRFSREPIPPAWPDIVSRNVPLAHRLPPDQQQRLFRIAQVFLRDHAMEGCQGFEVTEEVRVTIAVQASLLLLNLPLPCYPKLKRILVYPQTFVPSDARADLDKGATATPHATLGQAWQDGIVVLSWASTLVGSLNPLDGRNVVLHEFAHVLDQEDGRFDGFPLLDSPSAYRTWGYVMREHYDQQVRWARTKKPVLDEYAATNRAEFFAVATETFFERPMHLRLHAPDLYEELRKFYRQDPAGPVASTAEDGRAA